MATLKAASTAVQGALPAMKTLSPQKIKEVAQEFESVFLGNMFEEMFAGIEDGPFDGEGSATWRSLRTEEMAKSIAAAGGIGLADHVQRHLIALQEAKS
jgi:Rod binding domain-containing protein